MGTGAVSLIESGKARRRALAPEEPEGASHKWWCQPLRAKLLACENRTAGLTDSLQNTLLSLVPIKNVVFERTYLSLDSRQLDNPASGTPGKRYALEDEGWASDDLPLSLRTLSFNCSNPLVLCRK